MSFSSIYLGLSGVNAYASELTVIGNNIANMNTVAFKSSRATFADVLRNASGGDRTASEGGGVKPLAPMLDFTQGAMRESVNPMDWAIDGNGFFVVEDSAGETYYTRDGQFRLDTVDDDTLRVANTNGDVLQGYAAGADGVIGDTLADLTVSSVLNAKATTTATLKVNLKADASVVTGTFDPADSTTYNFSASQTIYDSRTGVNDVSHSLVTYFAKTASNTTGNTWQTYFQVDGGDVTTGGELVFDTTGELTSGATQTASVTIPITPPVTVPPTAPTTLTQSIAVDMTGTTQYGGNNLLLSQQQNGYNYGTLQSITLTDDGIIMGRFSNQVPQAIGQVGLASFEAPLDLTQKGSGRFSASEESGDATVVKPDSVWTSGSPSVGIVHSNMLEQSNTNLSEEFMNVIIAQRAFEANSKVIMTADAIIQTLETLKR